jgi:hypothetical protein
MTFAAALTAAIVAGTTIADKSPRAQADLSAAPTPVASVSAEMMANFAIFRERPPVSMPADVAAMMASPARFGRNANLAREISTPHGTGWIVPGDKMLCIIVPDPVDSYGTGCNTLASSLVRGLVLAMRDGPRGPGTSTALIPDGARATLSSGSLPLRSTTGVVSNRIEADEDLVVTPGTR